MGSHVSGISWNQLILRGVLIVGLISWLGFCAEWIFSGYTGYKRLATEISSLEMQQMQLRPQIAKLEKQLERGSDPAWIESLLIERLGMVPEGSTKVVFRPSHD